MRSDVEETETQKTKASDSGYSNSCSNSQSQRSSGSSKSRHSTSSGSSGFCPHLPNQSEAEGKTCGKRKDKEIKKKRETPTSNGQQEASPIVEALPVVETTSVPACADGSGGSNTLQTAALSQTFTAMRRIKSKEQSPDIEIVSTPPAKPVSSWMRDEVMQLVTKDMTHEVGQDSQGKVVLIQNFDKAPSTVHTTVPQQANSIVYLPINYSFSKVTGVVTLISLHISK